MIGSATLTKAQFGIMYKSTILEGIVGVSYPILETRNTIFGLAQYPNLPSLLVQQGYIASRAFSLWTNDDRSSAGTLLFGGIDTDKFIGKLVTIDLVPSGFDGFTGVVDFTLTLEGITGTTSGGAPKTFTDGATPINVVMDSGVRPSLDLFLLPPTLFLFLLELLPRIRRYSCSSPSSYKKQRLTARNQLDNSHSTPSSTRPVNLGLRRRNSLQHRPNLRLFPLQSLHHRNHQFYLQWYNDIRAHDATLYLPRRNRHLPIRHSDRDRLHHRRLRPRCHVCCV